MSWRRFVVLLVVLTLPVPWQHKSDSNVGVAWGMDNRLIVEGHRLDPPGQWSWLTAGRPAIVGELAWERGTQLRDPAATGGARDLRVGPAEHRPAHVEPVAATVGLAAAGRRGIRDPHGGVDAVLGGHGPPFSWLRRLATGPSHGLMVGLVTYASVAEEDLAAGRHVAGTGQLDEEGQVGRIGGLVAKALGARRAGADVLLVPAGQEHELDGLDLGGMQVLAVETLDDAILQLRATQ